MSQTTARKQKVPEHWITLFIVLAFIVVGTILALNAAPAELSWDEADYASERHTPWRGLWARMDYKRHGHGPLMIYLAKLGNALPSHWMSTETRLRLPSALLGAGAVGLAYWGLRQTFSASRTASLLGAALLLLSVIRLEETNIIGPHYPMLLWTVAIAIFGYRWRDALNWRHAVGLGVLFGLAGLTMAYWLPLVICWAVGVIASGGTWIQADRKHLKISSMLLITVATAAGALLLLWPPAITRLALLADFAMYVKHSQWGFATLVGDQMVQHAPRSVYLHWLAQLEQPLLLGILIGFGGTIRRAAVDRSLPLPTRYLAAFGGMLLATALSAHIAGARNLLLFVAVATLMAGATFDSPLAHRPRTRRLLGFALAAFAILNFFRLRIDAERVPQLFTGGYREFVDEQKTILAMPVSAIVDGTPIVKFYAAQSDTPIHWNISDMPWTTDPNAYLPESARYALLSETNYRFLPTDQPVRRIIVNQWKIVWSFKQPGTWGLRLYQNPN